jgi:uncharacterized membrane protein HdeD (DUF308 family)
MTSAEIRNVGDLLQAKWHWFLALGVVLIACGAFAVLLPSMSGAAASVVLGIVLAISGVVKIIEALQVRDWTGALWQLLLGCVEVVGGVLIYLNPLKGVLAITTLIAVVFLVQGVMQIMLALRVHPQAGWGWLLAAGLIALGVTAAMVLKLRYTSLYTPGTIAGVALLVAGFAYVVIALANRSARREQTPA